MDTCPLFCRAEVTHWLACGALRARGEKVAGTNPVLDYAERACSTWIAEKNSQLCLTESYDKCFIKYIMNILLAWWYLLSQSIDLVRGLLSFTESRIGFILSVCKVRSDSHLGWFAEILCKHIDSVRSCAIQCNTSLHNALPYPCAHTERRTRKNYNYNYTSLDLRLVRSSMTILPTPHWSSLWCPDTSMTVLSTSHRLSDSQILLWSS